MKEVTRIHIAKIAYDIELPAKKALQRYIDTLSTYANDTSVVEDIEIRITEILAERGVQAQGVITTQDVTAVKNQLGDPSEFISEGDVAVGPSHIDTADLPTSQHKLYRDIDTSLFGGVLSGIGAYFSINPVWIRLIFIVLTFVSFGLSVFVYVLLWIIVPPARTTAQKLELRGVVVNAATIRHFNSEENDAALAERQKKRKLTFGIIVGTLSTLGVILCLIAIAAVFGVSIAPDINSHVPQYLDTPVVYILGAACFVLPLLFFIVLAYAGFTTKFTKRIGISLLSIFIVGLLTIATTVGTVTYRSWSNDQAIRAEMKKSTTNISKEFAGRTKLTITNNYRPIPVQYIEDSTPRIEYYGLPKSKPEVSIKTTEDRVYIDYKFNTQQYYPEFQLTIYGPKLTEVSLEKGDATIRLQTGTLVTTQKAKTNLTLEGSIDTLSSTLEKGASLTGAPADIATVSIKGAAGVHAEFGTVRTATISVPDSCAADSNSSISFRKIIDPVFNYNDEELSSATTHEKSCIDITIGDDYRNTSYYEY